MKKIRNDFNFFYNSLGLKGWSINICDESYKHEFSLNTSKISAKEVGKYYKTLIDLWISKNDPNLRIREIENFISGILGLRSKNCSFNGTCGNYICIDFDGKIYPCDRFSNDDRFILGDLSWQSLGQIISGQKMQNFKKYVSERPVECKNCRWQNFCNNGCTAMRSSFSGKYIFCEARKATFEYLTELGFFYLHNAQKIKSESLNNGE